MKERSEPAGPVDSTSEIAAQLIAAYDTRSIVERIVTNVPNFDLAAAYEVLRHIERDRHVRGWEPAGRKIGFTNRTIWARYGVSRPMWARMWDRTVSFADDGVASVALEPFVQPRIEPEVVFKLAAPISASDNPEQTLSGVEWFAAGFEIVQCHFPEWQFNVAECTAAFGLHGTLIVGTPTPVVGYDLTQLADTLATFAATLSRDGSIIEQGGGANVLGSPALALDHLARILCDQPEFAPLAAGEIITTGTLTDALPIKSGERWTSDYGTLDIDGISISFT
jgi:2-oxo-3-hexenedioate decarboxylase